MNDELFYFLEGWAESAGVENLSEGAGQAVMMDGVEAFNEENGTHHDPHDTWLEWIQRSEVY